MAESAGMALPGTSGSVKPVAGDDDEGEGDEGAALLPQHGTAAGPSSAAAAAAAAAASPPPLLPGWRAWLADAAVVAASPGFWKYLAMCLFTGEAAAAAAEAGVGSTRLDGGTLWESPHSPKVLLVFPRHPVLHSQPQGRLPTPRCHLPKVAAAVRARCRADDCIGRSVSGTCARPRLPRST